MFNYVIDEDNYIGIAMHHYDNVQCNTVEEFQSDIYRIICIKKIIDRYKSSGKINIRLILNHVIVLYNAFGKFSIELLKLKLDDDYHRVVKSILVFLKYIESNDWNDVLEDVKICQKLRQI